MTCTRKIHLKHPTYNPGMTRWKLEPLKCSIFPERPWPFSPVQRHLKFSAVRGTTSARSSISMRPLGEPPMVMSKKTTGFSLILFYMWVERRRRAKVSTRSIGGAGGSVERSDAKQKPSADSTRPRHRMTGLSVTRMTRFDEQRSFRCYSLFEE